MCASRNVSFEEEKPDNIKRKKKNTGSFSESETNPSSQPTGKSEKDTSVQIKENKTKITLSDQFFDSNPDKEQKEHEELANIIKELYPEETKEKKGFKIPPKFGLIFGAALGIIIVVSILIAVLPVSKEIEDETETIEKKITKAVIEEEEEEEEVAGTIITEEEVEVEEDEIKEVEKEKKAIAAKVPPKRKNIKRAPSPVKQDPVVKKQQQVVKRPRVQTAPPKPNPTELFNKYLQEGHQAVSKRNFNDALNKYKSAAKIRPSAGSVYKFIGITYAHMQNQKEACANYKKYIQLAPNAADRAQVEALIKACP
ncbi:MAG TPA: hypothetical protein ENN58_01595 [bacterium]|nr:hypothetical protein [bacterium]